MKISFFSLSFLVFLLVFSFPPPLLTPAFSQEHSQGNSPKYSQISSLSEFRAFIAKVLEEKGCSPEKTLVVFDLDEVVTQDEFGGRVEDPELWEGEVTRKEIKKIMDLKVQVMAETARSAQYASRGIQPHFLQTTTALKGRGIDFSSSSPLLDKALKKKKLVKKLDGHGAVWADGEGGNYHKGIYSISFNRKGKGVMLLSLLNKAGLNDSFDCLFFVDDNYRNLLSMDEAFRKKMKNLYIFQMVRAHKDLVGPFCSDKI